MPLVRVPGQAFDALVGRSNRRGRLCFPAAAGRSDMPYRISRLGYVGVRSIDLDRDLDHYVTGIEAVRPHAGG